MRIHLLGHTFEREAVTAWLEGGGRACPLTNARLDDTDPATALVPNHTLRKAIAAWCVVNGQLPPPPPPPPPRTPPVVTPPMVPWRERAQLPLGPPIAVPGGYVRVGQKLEAVDVQYPSLICVATVAAVSLAGGVASISVTFDGWNSSYDYTRPLRDAAFFPCGSCERRGVELQPPGSGVTAPTSSSSSSGWASPFDWEDYLQRSGSEPVDVAVLGREAGSGLEPERVSHPHAIRLW